MFSPAYLLLLSYAVVNGMYIPRGLDNIKDKYNFNAESESLDGFLLNFAVTKKERAASEYWPQMVEGVEKRHSKREITLPLTNYQDVIYHADIQVGNSKCTVALDTGSSDLWVWGPGEGGQGGSYDTSTGKNTGEAFEISYLDNTASAGEYYTDSFGFGGSKLLDDFRFGVVSRSNDDSFGVLGIADRNQEVLANTAGKTYDNLPWALKKAGVIKSASYSLWLNGGGKNDGTILFGAKDDSKYDGDLVSYPIDKSANALAVNLQSVDLNGKSFNINKPVILDSGTTGGILPSEVMAHFDEIFKPTMNTPRSGLVERYVDCNQPDDKYVEFNFGKNKIRASYKDITMSFGQGRCMLGFTEHEDRYILGDAFLRNAYVYYDLDNQEISLAQAKNVDDPEVSNAVAPQNLKEPLADPAESSPETQAFSIAGSVTDSPSQATDASFDDSGDSDVIYTVISTRFVSFHTELPNKDWQAEAENGDFPVEAKGSANDQSNEVSPNDLDFVESFALSGEKELDKVLQELGLVRSKVASHAKSGSKVDDPDCPEKSGLGASPGESGDDDDEYNKPVSNGSDDDSEAPEKPPKKAGIFSKIKTLITFLRSFKTSKNDEASAGAGHRKSANKTFSFGNSDKNEAEEEEPEKKPSVLLGILKKLKSFYDKTRKKSPEQDDSESYDDNQDNEKEGFLKKIGDLYAKNKDRKAGQESGNRKETKEGFLKKLGSLYDKNKSSGHESVNKQHNKEGILQKIEDLYEKNKNAGSGNKKSTKEGILKKIESLIDKDSRKKEVGLNGATPTDDGESYPAVSEDEYSKPTDDSQYGSGDDSTPTDDGEYASDDYSSEFDAAKPTDAEEYSSDNYYSDNENAQPTDGGEYTSEYYNSDYETSKPTDAGEYGSDEYDSYVTPTPTGSGDYDSGDDDSGYESSQSSDIGEYDTETDDTDYDDAKPTDAGEYDDEYNTSGYDDAQPTDSGEFGDEDNSGYEASKPTDSGEFESGNDDSGNEEPASGTAKPTGGLFDLSEEEILKKLEAVYGTDDSEPTSEPLAEPESQDAGDDNDLDQGALKKFESYFDSKKPTATDA